MTISASNRDVREEVLNLSVEVLKVFFKELEEKDPKYFSKIKHILNERHIPTFLQKRYERTREAIRLQNIFISTSEKTWLSIERIKQLNEKWLTMSQIIKSLHKKKDIFELNNL